MVALAAALGVFHVPQQGIHLRLGEAAIGAHGAVTGHGPQKFVQMRLDTVAGAVFQQVGKHVAHQLRGLGLLQ
ncbi:hypothetical protein D9M70_491550 [compost metagenome]